MKRYSRKAAKKFFQRVGECVVTFALIEVGLDLCISYIHEDYNGKSLGIEPPRTALNRKLAYLRKALNGECDLPMPDMTSTLLERIEAAADHRNTIVHSLCHIIPSRNGSHFPIHRFSHRAGFSVGELSLQQLRAFNIHVLRLAKAAGSYAEVLGTGLRLSEESHEAFREILSEFP